MSSSVPTLGVEEEYQIVDAESRELRPRSRQMMPEARSLGGDEVQHELYQSQIEIATKVCGTLAEARAELVRLRRAVVEAAAKDGGRILASGTHPFSQWDDQQVTPKERYRTTALQYQQIARELIICGCHVHVAVPDKAAGVEVINRSRHWLAPLLALAANSPYWVGDDTGYASFRTQLWNRFPISGPPGAFASFEEYQELTRELVATDAIADETRIYWDMRLPTHIETVEFRVSDVCSTIDEAVMIAGLCRGLVRTTLDEAAAGVPVRPARLELLRSAHWRAARYGTEKDLVDVDTLTVVPATELIGKLLVRLRPALEDMGDWGEVSALVERTLRDGTGSRRQREAYRREGTMTGVVDFILAETVKEL